MVPEEIEKTASADSSTSDPKPKKPKTRVETPAHDTVEDGDAETLHYPESPSQRRRLKAAKPTAEACCTTNALTQSKLEDLKHVIRTPRQYPPTSTGPKLTAKKQLGNSHFAAKQEVEEKTKTKKASKEATEDKPAGLHGFTFQLMSLYRL